MKARLSFGALCLMGGLLSEDLRAASRWVESRIAPGLTVSAEISPPEPFLGQQFSVIYRLRASRPPFAIDIEPQHFSGFWTEIVPLDAASAASSEGKMPAEYLLRQVIACALHPGTSLLPPLSLKIRTSAALSMETDAWDVLAGTESIPLRVRPLPPLEGGGGFPLVGSLSGRISAGSGLERESLVLELEGTAQLPFFRPVEWLVGAEGLVLVPRLLGAESSPVVRDLGGERSLQLRHRQSWRIGIHHRDGSPPAATSLSLPVFDPDREAWQTVTIDAPETEGGAPQPPPHPAQAVVEREVGARSLWQVVLTALAVVAVAALGVLMARRRRQVEGGGLHSDPLRNLALLEDLARRAPRTFIETAHRFLEKQASVSGTPLAAGNDRLARCLEEIQAHRFRGGEPPAEVRARVLASIRELVERKAAPEGP